MVGMLLDYVEIAADAARTNYWLALGAAFVLIERDGLFAGGMRYG